MVADKEAAILTGSAKFPKIFFELLNSLKNSNVGNLEKFGYLDLRVMLKCVERNQLDFIMRQLFYFLCQLRVVNLLNPPIAISRIV